MFRFLVFIPGDDVIKYHQGHGVYCKMQKLGWNNVPIHVYEVHDVGNGSYSIQLPGSHLTEITRLNMKIPKRSVELK